MVQGTTGQANGKRSLQARLEADGEKFRVMEPAAKDAVCKLLGSLKASKIWSAQAPKVWMKWSQCGQRSVSRWLGTTGSTEQ